MPNELPEGLTFTPPQTDPELPEGLTFDTPEPPKAVLPEGLTFDNPAAPVEKPRPTEDPITKPNSEAPGFWDAIVSSFKRGLVDRTLADIGGAQAILPKDWGGKTLEEMNQEKLLHPETQDEINKLLGEKITDGWNDPKWYGANIAHGMGGMVPGAAAMLAGSVFGGAGAVAGMAGEAGLGTIVPSYQAARAKGLNEDQALTRSIVDSGIATAFGTAMGIIPGASLFGRVQQEGAEQVAQLLKYPVAEALTQMGIVLPSLGTAQGAVTTLTHGEVPGWEDLAKDYFIGLGVGAGAWGAHQAAAGSVRIGAKALPSARPATPEEIQRAFQSQVPNVSAEPGAIRLGETPPAEVAAMEDVLYPREDRIFYSPTLKAVHEKVPENATVEQVIGTLKNSPGVKEEELLDLNLPQYLSSVEGKVNKADLIAHIESNGLILEERTSPLDFDPEYANQVLPGERSNYRELLLKVPIKNEPDPFKVEERAKDTWDYNYAREFGPWEQAGEFSREGMRKQARNFFLQEDPTVFTGSHWQDPNVLAHVRATDRTGRNGERLLHVEEIQSDIHQMGRRAGYRAKEAPEISVEDAQRNVDRARFKYENARQYVEAQGLVAHEDPYLQELRQGWRDASNVFNEAVQQMGKAPDLPFKSNWSELAVKRVLRLAADEGYDGVSWTTGDQVGLRLGTAKQLQGSREFYDKQVSRLFKKWADKLGADVQSTRFDVRPEDYYSSIPAQIRVQRERLHQEMGVDPNRLKDNYFVKLNPAFGSKVRMGLPLYETEPSGKGKVRINDIVTIGTPEALIEPAKKIAKISVQIAKDLKLSRKMNIVMEPNKARWRGKAELRNGEYVVNINLNRLRTPEDLYATAAHEIGHLIYWDKFANLDHSTRTLIFDEFRKFRESVNLSQKTVGDVRRLRDNAISEMTGARNLPDWEGGKRQNDIPLSDLQTGSREYLLHFKEWFAEQVAKWATTSDKPLSRVDKFYKSLGQTIRNIIERFLGRKLGNAEAVPVMQKWLDSLMKDTPEFISDIKDKHELDGKRLNAEAMNRDGTPEVRSVPPTALTVGGRDIIDSLPPELKGPGNAMAAHADRMNRFWEWMTSLPQIADMNKHIRGLQIYKEVVALMNLEKNNIMGDAHTRLKQWKLVKDPKQLFGLNKFIEDYANGMFKLTDDGIIRRPTATEFQKLAEKHKLSGQSLRVFEGLVADFDGFLEKYRNLLMQDAARIKDPVAQLQAIESANTRIDNMLKRPFFPLTRFGKYTITVYDHAGNVRHFEQTDSLRQQKKIAAALEKSSDLLPGDRVRTGEVPKDATPLLGMPPGFIDLVADKLSLSRTQRGMLDQLRFDYAPSQSFRHQFKAKDVTPGYSTDFQRAYAHFFFHGANHITRVKWVDALRDQIKDVKKGSIDLNDAVKRDKIANYMTEHLDMLVDPKPDFAALRGLMFHWFLGFNPASATLNLSQTPIMTYPHLASKFGDLRSVAAISRAGLELNNFYKKGTIQELAKNAPPGPAGSKFRALAEAVKEGVISETQAHTLAAVSEDRNLLRAFGNRGEEFWQKFSEASSWMFEMTEQYNRRVAFRAAWDLAMRDPNGKYVQQTVRDNPLQYQRLRDSGWSHQEAAAFTAAKDSVEKTQFVYAPYSRPKFMWGRKGALFIFKSFVQNSLFNMWNNKAMGARSLLIMGALGGLMGLPGTENVNSIIKALGWKLFGKDWDVEDEARKFAIDVTHGNISPDLLLHGMSVHGFGIPHVMNGMGSLVGLPKFFPTLDRSKSISMGDVTGFDPFAPLQPVKDPKGAEFQQLQRAAGAGFGNLFALYNFLTSTQNLSELKRWEQIMPRFMSNMSHAYRYATRGEEVNKAGNTVVRFDPHDTMQMAEILARAAGYQPRRLTARWESIQAQQEASTYWDLRRGILLRQFGDAVKSQNPEDRARVVSSIRSFNQELPPEARMKALTSQALKESVQQRLKVKAKQEAGLPLAKSDIPLSLNLQKYYPEGLAPNQVGAKPVQ